MTVRVVLAIDVEPDPRLFHVASENDWQGLRASHPLAGLLRERLSSFQSLPVTFSWLLRMDQQMRRVYGRCGWIAERFSREWERLLAAGDDIGLHTHLVRWDDTSNEWFTDNESPEWRELSVKEGAAAFRASFAKPCAVHSFGDRFASEDAVDLLEGEGMLLDTTVEPGMVARPRYVSNEAIRGGLPDYSTAPHRLWRPRPGDFLSDHPNGTRTLRMLPVSTYRFPLYFEPGRRIELALRRLRGQHPSEDDVAQRYVRVCCAQRAYVFRRGCAILMAEHAPTTMQFRLRSHQLALPAVRERVIANLGWLARGGLGVPVEFVSGTRMLVAIDEEAAVLATGEPGVSFSSATSSATPAARPSRVARA